MAPTSLPPSTLESKQVEHTTREGSGKLKKHAKEKKEKSKKHKDKHKQKHKHRHKA